MRSEVGVAWHVEEEGVFGEESSYGGGGAGRDGTHYILFKLTVEELNEGAEGGETVLPDEGKGEFFYSLLLLLYLSLFISL